MTSYRSGCKPLFIGFKFHHGDYPLDSQQIKIAYRPATYSDSSLYLKIEHLQPL